MTLLVRRLGTSLKGIGGTAILAVGLPAVALAQTKSEFTKPMGIDQKLGATVPKDATFRDETGKERTLGSLLQGRPVMIVPFPLKRTSGCGIAIEGLQKTLFRADKPNEHKLFQKAGPNLLQIGKQFDLVFLSLDPAESPRDAADTKNEFETKVGYDAEPLAALTGDESNIKRVADALGFRYYYNPMTKAMRNPTGSVLLTPDGRISSYVLGNDYQTKELETNLALAQAGKIGTRADDSQMFACVQLDAGIIERRGKIESVITGFALLTLAAVVYWIGSMLRDERRQHRMGGQPNA